MAVDILEMLMSFLCQRDTLSQCQSFVQEYQDPVWQAIYFFFFPTVFVILFIYVLSDKVAKNIDPKFKAMIGVAIFVFIVMQGWYYVLLMLSKFWFVSIIVLGGLHVFLNMGIGGGGDGKAASHGQKAIHALTRYPLQRAVGAIRGEEKSICDEIETLMKSVEDDEKLIKEYENRTDMFGVVRTRDTKLEKLKEIKTLVGRLKEATSFEGTKLGEPGKLKQYKSWLKQHYRDIKE